MAKELHNGSFAVNTPEAHNYFMTTRMKPMASSQVFRFEL